MHLPNGLTMNAILAEEMDRKQKHMFGPGDELAHGAPKPPQYAARGLFNTIQWAPCVSKCILKKLKTTKRAGLKLQNGRMQNRPNMQQGVPTANAKS